MTPTLEGLCPLDRVLEFLYFRKWWRLHRIWLAWRRFVHRVECCQIQPLEFRQFVGVSPITSCLPSFDIVRRYERVILASFFGIPESLL